MKTRILILLSIAFIIDLNISAQSSVNTKSVYLHTDRSYYAPGESVFFKAYILNNPIQIKDTLHVALIDQEGIEITNGAFPLENSLFSSGIDIPDFLSEGSYMLVASTSVTGNLSPADMFSKIVEIRNTRESDINIDLSLTDSVYKPGSTLTAHIKISGATGPVNFTYQLSGTSEEILSGKEKTTSEGTSVLKIQLPEFDNNQVLKLLIKPGYKGTRKVSGIVIPTKPGSVSPESNPVSEASSQLNIQVSTLKQVYVSGDKVQLAITVTNEKGQPVMANLSVSASNLIPFRFPVDYNSITEYIRYRSAQNKPGAGLIKSENVAGPELVNTFFNANIRNYYAQSLISFNQIPGRPFIVQEKNNVKKLQKRQQAFIAKSGYSTDFSIMDIIMQIKPYHIENGKITFGMRSPNSINNQDGALIVVDGVKLGSDASILGTIPVADIAHINVLTSPMDIQRYSAMNSVGVIEITMKKSAEFARKEQPVSRGNTLFWEPDLIIDNSGRRLIDFFTNDNTEEVIITINGIDGKGIYGSASMRYSVTH